MYNCNGKRQTPFRWRAAPRTELVFGVGARARASNAGIVRAIDKAVAYPRAPEIPETGIKN